MFQLVVFFDMNGHISSGRMMQDPSLSQISLNQSLSRTKCAPIQKDRVSLWHRITVLKDD